MDTTTITKAQESAVGQAEGLLRAYFLTRGIDEELLGFMIGDAWDGDFSVLVNNLKKMRTGITKLIKTLS